jgi:hypothetical protein
MIGRKTTNLSGQGKNAAMFNPECCGIVGIAAITPVRPVWPISGLRLI